jgi:hypothetical protein
MNPESGAVVHSEYIEKNPARHIKRTSCRFHEERIAHHQERIQYHKNAEANSRKDRESARAQDGNKRLYMTSGKLRILFVDLGNVCRFIPAYFLRWPCCILRDVLYHQTIPPESITAGPRDPKPRPNRTLSAPHASFCAGPLPPRASSARWRRRRGASTSSSSAPAAPAVRRPPPAATMPSR